MNWQFEVQTEAIVADNGEPGRQVTVSATLCWYQGHTRTSVNI